MKMNDSILNSLSETRKIDSDKTRFGKLLSPLLSNIFLFTDIFFLLLLFYFHYLITLMIKRENRKKGQNLIKNLLRCYAVITPVAYFVIFCYINVLTRQSTPPSMLIGHWLCESFESVGHFTILYIGGFSLFAAGVKYWFIVHSASAIQFGEEKARKAFLISHFVIPFVLAGLNSASNGNIDQIFWVDHCWGHKRDLEFKNNTISTKLGSLFCVNRQYEITNYFGDNVKSHITIGLRSICGSLKIFYFLFLSNIAEFLFYFLVFKYLNR